MSDAAHSALKHDLEVALLRKALLSSSAATNAVFEALLALSTTLSTDARDRLLEVVARRTEHLDEALAYIKEAQDVRVGV